LLCKRVLNKKLTKKVKVDNIFKRAKPERVGDKMEKIYLIGINHIESSTEEIEEFSASKPQNILKTLIGSENINGIVELNTCLRREIYFGYNGEIDKNMVTNIFGKKVYCKNGIDAIYHLFEVICGFHSIIPGEDQILSQIKKSYQKSLDEKRGSRSINVFFNHAIAAGKRYREESKVTYRPLSLENIAVKFIEEQMKNIDKKKIFIIGTGELARGVLNIIYKKGFKNITVTSRTTEKSEKISKKYQGIKNIGFEQKNIISAESDIIISATTAPHFILRYKEIEKEFWNGKKIVILDLAVPRDIDPEIGRLEGVSLYNLDNIWEVYGKNAAEREKIMKEYSYIVVEEIERLKDWFKRREKI
jgi:glutamyl-tRNA reductase